MNFQRDIFWELDARLKQGSKLIQVIIGPRQVGKTTLVKQLFQSKIRLGVYHTADAVLSNGALWLESIYNEAQLMQKQSDLPVVLAIDEIQKISNWSEIIKKLVDQHKFNNDETIQLILLGSSHWLLQKGLSESLAGRFEQWNLGHWTYQELKTAFNLTPEEYVFFGAYPGTFEFYHDEERWRSYVRNSLIETVISKDVLLMHRIEKPALLRSLFELGIQYSGQILSYTKVLGQMQEAKNTTTLSHYLDLLQQAGLLCGLQKFAIDKARQRSSSPKWQVMNNALISSLGVETFSEAQVNLKSWGRRVESAIGAHFLSYQKEDLKLFYWNESNAEVDFVIQWKDKYVGLEVKLSKDKVSGLHRFANQFKPYKIYQLSEVGLSWQKLISMDPRELF
jgi:hypothetical protein